MPNCGMASRLPCSKARLLFIPWEFRCYARLMNSNHVYSTANTNGKQICGDAHDVPAVPGRDVESLLNSDVPKQPDRRKKFSCCLIFRVFVCSFLFISFAAISSFYLYNMLTVCSSQECVLSAGRLMVNMDTTVDPCTDFYSYACGSWINSTVSLNYPNLNMLYRTTVTAHDRVVKAILEASAGKFAHPLNEGEKAVVKVFAQCADTDALADVGLVPVQQLLKDLRGWMPDLSPVREEREVSILAVVEEENEEPVVVMVEDAEHGKKRRRREQFAGERIEDLLLHYFYNLSTFPLFFAGVQVSYKNSSQHIITIYEQVPLLFKTQFYQGPVPTVESILQEGGNPNPIVNMLQELGEDMIEVFGEKPTAAMRRRIAEMIILEWRITNCKPRETLRENDQYDVLSIKELQKIAPALDWKYFLSRLTGLQLSDPEEVAVKHGIEWMVQINQIIAEYKSSFENQMVLRSYMKWKVLLFYLSYTKTKCENTTHKTLWFILKFYAGPAHLRKEFCVMRLSGIFPLSLPSILRKMEGVEHVNKNKEIVEKLSENVRATYSEVISGSTILDEYTRKNVQDKLSNVSVKVCFPVKMNDVSEMEAEAERASSTFFDSMLVGAVNLYRFNVGRLRKPVDPRDWLDTKPALSSVPVHNYERNLVILPMDALNQPIADYRQIDSLNYAGIGTILGHEITHGFDGEGKQHGPTGSLGKHFWSEFSKEKYAENEECIVNHYSNLTQSAAATNSRYENMADIVGIEVAYKAWLQYGTDRWQRTSGLPLSPSQRFFVAYAQSWCALESNEAGRNVHLTERLRVTGALRNSKSFASAFSCPADSFMNPKEKCTVW